MTLMTFIIMVDMPLLNLSLYNNHIQIGCNNIYKIKHILINAMKTWNEVHSLLKVN